MSFWFCWAPILTLFFYSYEVFIIFLFQLFLGILYCSFPSFLIWTFKSLIFSQFKINILAIISPCKYNFAVPNMCFDIVVLSLLLSSKYILIYTLILLASITVSCRWVIFIFQDFYLISLWVIYCRTWMETSRSWSNTDWFRRKPQKGHRRCDGVFNQKHFHLWRH